MGYSTIFDVIGAIIIGGAVALIAIRANGTFGKMAYTYGSELNVQKNMTTVVRMLETDLRKCGYCAEPDSFTMYYSAIRGASQHSITFLADLDFNKRMDTVRYYTGTVRDLSSTTNPRDFVLYRSVNSTNVTPMYVGLTQFDFKFFNWNGDSLTFPILMDSVSQTNRATGIFSLQLTVMMESQETWDNLYAYAYWRQLRLTAMNLRLDR